MAKKILVVDDEPVIVKVVASRLKANGYDVISAADGQEALTVARAEKPDLIILDVMLPKMDGYRVCSLLKFDDHFKKIPILMFSARVQEEDKQRGIEAGADDYMVKPFDPKVLLEKIEALLK